MFEISSQIFTWDRESRLFVGDASLLEHELRGQWCQGRLEWRLAQWGFYMRSQWTGRRAWFQKCLVIRDGNNDIRYEVFRAYQEPPRKELTLHLFNT